MSTKRTTSPRSRLKGRRSKPTSVSAADPLWYKNAVIYQVHVRAFHDSNGDGVGDFAGLTEKLDYLQDLGVTAIWVLPFYPSPLKDDGYDIARYTAVHPSYGTLRNAKQFIDAAHARGMAVITEMVLNHTSDQHRWFQKARRAPAGSKLRDFYVWSDNPHKYDGVRIIFKDFETSNWSWDHVAQAYFWHRFYSHQPDLNYDNPAVHEAMLRIVDDWLEMGVDGIRLDAVPYLYEREGTSCENLPETHEFLKKLRAHVDRRFRGKMLLAEANQWPEDAVAYFGEGDECHMAFHFPVMPRLFMALRMEDRFPIIDILNQTPRIPDTCQWAMFLRNHDELTLEMVTDEERDYMYRMYAGDRQARINLGVRRRLAPLLENNRRKIELMNALLFSLTGTPVIYYGDEIGMGDNIYLGDRNGVRTPMQWSADRNAGFSRANPQRLFLPVIIDPEYHYESINVEAQQRNPSSLLWWMKRLIALRRRHPVFGTGEITFLNAENPKILAFIRSNEKQRVLVVANLSRFVQAVELNLADYRGWVPVEMFGQTDMPQISEQPYPLMIGPHGFYWFSLEQKSDAAMAPAPDGGGPEVVEIDLPVEPHRWHESRVARTRVERVLLNDVPRRRWFRSKARRIRDMRANDIIELRTEGDERDIAVTIVIAEFTFAEAEPDTYVIPLAVSAGGAPAVAGPSSIIAVLNGPEGERATMFDAMSLPEVGRSLLELAQRRRRSNGQLGKLYGTITRDGRRLAGDEPLPVHVSRAEQSNSSVIFGDRLLMKLFRKIEPGENPDLELSRHLTQQAGFKHTPPLAGSIEYRASEAAEPATVAIIQGYVANEGDAWQYTLSELSRFYERIGSMDDKHGPPSEHAPYGSNAMHAPETSGQAWELIGQYLHNAALLGQRTAEMHIALAKSDDEPAIDPEPFTMMYQRSLYQSMRNSAHRSLQLLAKKAARLPEPVQAMADQVVAGESEIIGRMRGVSRKRLSGLRIRCHGDYHLGQVLWTGRDFVIIDFEGEPARPLGERRLKRTPLRDVAGMMRSFDYAANAALRELLRGGGMAETDQAVAEYQQWARYWESWVSARFLASYLETVRSADDRLLPADEGGLQTLLDAWLLEKAMYEIGYELNNRPDWIDVPLRGAIALLASPPDA